MRHIELTAIVAMLYACVTGGAYGPCEGTPSRWNTCAAGTLNCIPDAAYTADPV